MYGLKLNFKLVALALTCAGYDDQPGGFDLTKHQDCTRALTELITFYLASVTGDSRDEEIRSQMQTLSSELKFWGREVA